MLKRKGRRRRIRRWKGCEGGGEKREMSRIVWRENDSTRLFSSFLTCLNGTKIPAGSQSNWKKYKRSVNEREDEEVVENDY